MADFASLITPDALSKVRVPSANSNVWKEECIYSFHTQDDEGGILVDLSTWLSFSPEFAKHHHKKTGRSLFLNIKRTRVDEPPKEEEKPAEPTTLAQLSFDEKPPQYTFDYALVVLPSFKSQPAPFDGLPIIIQQSIDAIIKIGSAEKKQEISSFVDTEEVTVSQVAPSLVQLQTGKKLPSEGWTCDECGGDGTTNLWLNLMDGHIGCGRKNFDGSGGNGHALSHYNQCGYSLVVKLGTITPDGVGTDVFCYLENKFVSDPLLDQHLKHWGLDMKKLAKTDKTVAELELELQFSFDWSKGAEKGKDLVPLYGPGFTGLENLGNTCYMASVMQVLFKIPSFNSKFFGGAKAIFESDFQDPANSFYLQMAKLADGLCSGDHSKKPVEGSSGKTWVRPLMFKTLVGKNHPEFSTGRQQDALEFLQHILALVERNVRARGDNDDPSKIFAFETEEKLQCTASNCVSFKRFPETMLLLPIPLDQATNKADVAIFKSIQDAKSEEQKKREKETRTEPEEVRLLVPLQACFNAAFSPESISNWYSPAIKSHTICMKRKSFATFPQFLILQMARFTQEGLLTKKLDVFLDVPDELDLEHLRALGQQPGEELMVDSPPPLKIDEGVVASLQEMGFPRRKCEWAWYHNQGKGSEVALEWLFGHMDDPSLDGPLPIEPAQGQTKEFDEVLVETLSGMGFSKTHVIKALSSTGGDAERAADWLFSHPDEPMEEEKPKIVVAPKSTTDDGPGRYKLFGFITHMGTSTASGHYVAHVNVDGKWVLFDDRAVKESQDEPRQLAYIYFYRRV